MATNNKQHPEQINSAKCQLVEMLIFIVAYMDSVIDTKKLPEILYMVLQLMYHF